MKDNDGKLKLRKDGISENRKLGAIIDKHPLTLKGCGFAEGRYYDRYGQTLLMLTSRLKSVKFSNSILGRKQKARR
jgi:hypothetical protein